MKQHHLPNRPTFSFQTFLLPFLLLLALTLVLPSMTQSASWRSDNGRLPADGCTAVGNTLYLLDGASVGVNGSLSFTAGSAATSDTIPNTGSLIYNLTNVSGTYTSGSTDFNLFLDSGTAVANEIQAEIRYDFDGNGSFDRTESYNPFPTNDLDGWEIYTESNRGGLQSATAGFSNLSNGTIQIEIRYAHFVGASDVRTSATSGDGQQSALEIPFSGLTASGCNTSTPTATPTASNTPTITPIPTETPYQTPTVTPTPSPTATPATSLCEGVANTENALPGVGCYTTNLPAGETSVTFWPAVDDSGSYSPATPKTTSNYSGPLQTNDWWSSLIWDWNQGAGSAPPREPFSQVMHPHPISLQAEASGLRLSYAQELQFGTNVAGSGGVTGFANFLLPGSGAEHLKVTVDGLNATTTEVDGYSDWAVTAAWEDGADTLKATFGHGIPYNLL